MTDTTSKPVPIVVCGKVESVGKPVVEGMKPEYEVIHFCLGAVPTSVELPLILSSPSSPFSSSSPPSSMIGTGNFARPPFAVVFGGAWDGDDVQLVRAAIRDVKGPDGERGSDVILLRADPEKQKGMPDVTTPEYGARILQRTKEVLGRLVKGEEVGREGAGDGAVWY